MLSLSGIICKIIGAVYRVPLSNILGAREMGYYQMAYPYYTFLVTVSTAGIPIAVSKLVAEKLSLKDECGASKVLNTARRSLLAIGLICSLALFLLADTLSKIASLPAISVPLKIISPSLVFVALVSGYRGYMQGRMNMTLTAVSQTVEQVSRLAAGVGFSLLFKDFGPGWAAGGAMTGVLVSEICGYAVMAAHCRIKGYIAKNKDCRHKKGGAAVLKSIYKIAFPVTIGALAVSAVSVIDSSMIMRILIKNGFSENSASSAYGLLAGFVSPVINMPSVLTGAVSVSVVPAVSAAAARKNITRAAYIANTGFRLVMIVSFPCAIGLFILAEPILGLMYSSLDALELKSAVYLLRLLSPCVVLLGITQICSGVLQGMGRTVLPVTAMLLGALLKVFIGLWLIKIPGVNIAGAAIGTLICFFAAAFACFLFLKKYAKMSADVKDAFLIPFLSALLMGVLVFITEGYIKGAVGTIISVLAGIVSYAIILLKLGGVRPEDMRFVPGGEKLGGFLTRLKIWR